MQAHRKLLRALQGSGDLDKCDLSHDNESDSLARSCWFFLFKFKFASSVFESPGFNSPVFLDISTQNLLSRPEQQQANANGHCAETTLKLKGFKKWPTIM
jgi:hypothetical protein